MNTGLLSSQEQLALLKNAYLEAFKLYQDCYTEEALAKLHASEDAYMSYIEDDDLAQAQYNIK